MTVERKRPERIRVHQGLSLGTTVREAMSEVNVHQDEQETTKKAPYLQTSHQVHEF